MSFLVSVEEAVAPEGRPTFSGSRDAVEQADDAEGLPEALTTNCVPDVGLLPRPELAFRRSPSRGAC